jgi:3'-5' exoribonuclease 1
MYIIYDLEHLAATRQRDSNSVIEIGALKLNSRLEVIDHFHSLVKPRHYNKGYWRTYKLTKIDLDDLLKAPYFDEVIKVFQYWITQSNQEYFLCSWGNDDRQTIIDDCIRNSFDTSWINNSNDIQPAISSMITNGQITQLSLKTATRHLLCDPKFEFQQHSAIDDAWFTTLLFIEYFEKLEFVRNEVDRSKIFAKTVYRDEDKFSNNPFDKLSEILNRE